jgi:hypothetical protein
MLGRKYNNYHISIVKKLMINAALFFSVLGDLHAHSGKSASATIKAGPPINYYQNFMLCVAGVYGIYLFVRARRKKKERKDVNL